MKLLLLLAFSAWVCCSVLSYGINFAYFQRAFPTLAKFDYKKDKYFSIAFSVAGPFSLVITYFMSDFAKYGLKFK